MTLLIDELCKLCWLTDRKVQIELEKKSITIEREKRNSDQRMKTTQKNTLWIYVCKLYLL